MVIQDLWVLLHVLSAVVAFGALFVQPMVLRSAAGAREGFARSAAYVQAPALVVLIATGIAAMYSIGHDFADPWVSVAFSVWTAMAVVLFFLVRALRSGSAAVAPLNGVMHVLLVVALWAMVFQPGLGSGS